jgi:hypothetical protein
MLPAKPKHMEISQDAWQKLLSFYQQFSGVEGTGYGYDHLVFACHVAFTVAFSPRMANLIWLNFNTYTFRNETRKIDPVVVSDLLLSSLVRRSGNRQFELLPDIRNYLLHLMNDGRWLKASRITFPGTDRLRQMAQFIIQYFGDKRSSADHPSPELRKLNLWAAKAYLSPDALALELAKAYQSTFDPSDGPANEFEQLKISLWIDRFNDQLQSGITTASPESRSAFANLHLYSNGNRSLLFGEDQHITSDYFYALEDRYLRPKDTVSQISLPLGRSVGQRLERRKQQISRLIILLIDTGASQEYQASINSFPLQEIKAALLSLAPGVIIADPGPVELSGSLATRAHILTAITDCYEQALDEDTVLIYYIGDTAIAQGPPALVPYDSVPNAIEPAELAGLIENTKKGKRCATLLFIDAPLATEAAFIGTNAIQISVSGQRQYGSFYNSPRNDRPFGALLSEVIRKTEGRVTCGELFFLLRIFCQRDRHDQLPSIISRSIPLDRPLFGQSLSDTSIGTYFLSYSKFNQHWRLLHEHFRFAYTYEAASLLSVDGKTIENALDLLHFENNKIIFRDSADRLDAEKLYRVKPGRPALRLKITGQDPVEATTLRTEMEQIRFNEYTLWSGLETSNRKPNRADTSLNIRIITVEGNKTDRFELNYQESNKLTIDWTVRPERLVSSLHKFARYRYLSTLRADQGELRMRPVFVQTFCSWGEELRSRRSFDHQLKIDLSALSIEAGRIRVKPLLISLRSEEDSDLYVEIYLLTQRFRIINLFPGKHLRLAPQGEMTLDYENNELFLQLLRGAEQATLQFLYSRDPIWEDLTQEGYDE